MLKISRKLNCFSNINLFSHFKNKQKMPVVKKPLVSYMLFKEQEYNMEKYDMEEMIKNIGKQATKTTSSMLGLSGIFSAISVLSEAKREVETKQEQKTKTETITSTQTQHLEKTKEAYEDNDDEDYDISYIFPQKKQSFFTKFMSNISNSVSNIIYSIKNWDYQRKARKDEIRQNIFFTYTLLRNKIKDNDLQTMLDKKLAPIILSPRKISMKKLEKVLDKINILLEQKKLEEEEEAKRIQEENQFNQLKTSYERQLNQYRNMFADGDMYPELPELHNYQNYTFLQLQETMNKLSNLIDHQNIINTLKNRYQDGAERYANDDEYNSLKGGLPEEISNHRQSEKAFIRSLIYSLQNEQPEEINPDYDKSGGRQYRKELKRLCELFLIHSKMIGKSVDAFKNVSKTYYDSAKDKIEEIYELKGNLRFAEMAPFIGVLPKTVRVADQYNLTRCILHDYEDIIQKYVKNGIQLKIKKYGEQYDKIEKFTKAHKHSSKDKQYTEIMLNMINNVKKERLGVYAKLYSNFIQAGLSIKHICYNIRLKDGMSWAIKTVKVLHCLG